MGNKHTKSKPVKDKNSSRNVFFRAFFVSFGVTVLVWIVLAVVFSLVMSSQTDSSLIGKILSPLLPALSLAAGGFALGKLDKANSALASLLLGCAFLCLCYLISSALGLSKDMGMAVKTAYIALMLLSPAVGAKMSDRGRRKNVRHKRRL